MDIARGKMVEGELDRLIEWRSRQKDPDEESEFWKESVRTYEERRPQMARLEWRLSLQAARHRATSAALIEHHEGAAAKLTEDQPKGAA